METHKIRYTVEAVNDLDGIFGYIAEDNRDAAMRMLTQIEESIRRLSSNPRMGIVLSEELFSLLEPGYRRIVVPPYNIFYRIGEREVLIARVLHGRRDWMHLLVETDIAPD